jgi:hypothetical protein
VFEGTHKQPLPLPIYRGIVDLPRLASATETKRLDGPVALIEPTASGRTGLKCREEWSRLAAGLLFGPLKQR